MTSEGELKGGPQDGAKVKGVGGNLPSCLFVGPRWMGDGFAAWGREQCERFPVCYLYGGRGLFNWMPGVGVCPKCQGQMIHCRLNGYKCPTCD